MRLFSLAQAITVVVALLTSSCGTSPYVSCNLPKGEWEYLTPRKLEEMGTEMARLVAETQKLEAKGNVQRWFRKGNEELHLCSQPRHARDICFSSQERFQLEGGKWTSIDGDEIVCTE